ncbi:MAG: hypothetical protein QOD50_2274, partial [Actinomycetota bacterium]|nr:hypothetical protein [Actinomycetota bacterium]
MIARRSFRPSVSLPTVVLRAFLGASTALLIVGLPAEHATASVSGAAIGWGANDFGQLGNDSRTERHVPVQVSGLTAGVSAVSAGGIHSLALKADGSVVSWGANNSGALGDGSGMNSSVPVQVSGLTSGVVAVSAGSAHSLAVKSNGSVVGWGYNGFGQVGDGTGGAGDDVIKPVPVQVSGLTSGVVAVAGGEFHSLALKSNGSVVAWGDNAFGQLGDGTTHVRYVPVQVSGLTSGVVAIAAGAAGSMALKSNGSVVTWGDNTYGELGDGTTKSSRVPVQVSGLTSGVVAIAAGGVHNLALKSDGSVVAWGNNGVGQLGDGTTTNRHVPVPVSGLSSGV